MGRIVLLRAMDLCLIKRYGGVFDQSSVNSGKVICVSTETIFGSAESKRKLFDEQLEKVFSSSILNCDDTVVKYSPSSNTFTSSIIDNCSSIHYLIPKST